MRENRCVCCGVIVPEGRMICPTCEITYIKVGMALQSVQASAEEVNKAYNSINKTTEEDHDA